MINPTCKHCGSSFTTEEQREVEAAWETYQVEKDEALKLYEQPL
jgi:transposase-like protein